MIKRNTVYLSITSAALSVVLATQAFTAELTNVATRPNGARIAVEHDRKVVRNKETPPESMIDGNARSRCVMTGTPYTVILTMLEPVSIDHLLITASSYPTEAVAKDIEITFDDGATIQHTLEKLPATGNRPNWQRIPVGGKTSQNIRITVKSTYEAQNNWGGIGDIAVMSSTDLSSKVNPPADDSNSMKPFVNAPSMAADNSGIEVKLPEPLAKDVYPRTVLSAADIEKLRAAKDSPRYAQAYRHLINRADDAIRKDPEFPDPKGKLAQVESRGDAPAKAHDALSMGAGNLGRAYAITGEKKYAEGAAKILLGYAKLYESYPEHKGVNRSDTGKIMAQRLSEAMWLIPQIQAFDLIYDSGVLSDEDKKLIETGLIRPCINFIWRKTPAQMVADRDRSNANWRQETPPRPERPGNVGNWLLFYNSATMLAGAVLQDQDMIDIAAANFRSIIRNGISADGMWNEGAIGYQYFAMHGMMAGVETAARHGIDLWSFDDMRLKRLFDSPLMYAYPDGSMPGINDSGRSKPEGSWQTIVYDYAYLRYGDDRHAAIVNASPRQLGFSQGVFVPTLITEQLDEPPAVNYPSVVFDALGYAILRTDDVYALMDYGQHGGVHGHLDKLNLILYGLGDELGGEPQFHRYEDPVHAEWTKQTIAHNTMAVDERSQGECTGKLLAYEASANVKIMRGIVDTAYPGALLDRTVVLADGMVIDLYSGRSNYDRTWDRTLRFNGTLNHLRDASLDDAQPLGRQDGYQHVKVAETQPASDGWLGEWAVPNNKTLRVAVAGRSDQNVYVGTGPDKDQIAIVRQKGKSADVGVVYQLTDGDPITTRILDSGNEKVVAMQIRQGDRPTAMLLVCHGAANWESNGWKSDAQILYITLDGDTVKEVLMIGGTSAENAGRKITQPQPGNVHATMSDGSFRVETSWHPETR